MHLDDDMKLGQPSALGDNLSNRGLVNIADDDEFKFVMVQILFKNGIYRLGEKFQPVIREKYD